MESFYESERIPSFIFYQSLLKLSAEKKILTPIQIKISNGGRIQFENAEIARLIDSYYPGNFSGSFLTESDNSKKQRRERCLPEDTILHASKDEKEAFIVGAYIRWGKSNCFRFANNHEKAGLIKRVLKDLLGAEVQLEVKKGRPSSLELCMGSEENVNELVALAERQKEEANKLLQQTPSWGRRS